MPRLHCVLISQSPSNWEENHKSNCMGSEVNMITMLTATLVGLASKTNQAKKAKKNYQTKLGVVFRVAEDGAPSRSVSTKTSTGLNSPFSGAFWICGGREPPSQGSEYVVGGIATILLRMHSSWGSTCL